MVMSLETELFVQYTEVAVRPRCSPHEADFSALTRRIISFAITDLFSLHVTNELAASFLRLKFWRSFPWFLKAGLCLQVDYDCFRYLCFLYVSNRKISLQFMEEALLHYEPSFVLLMDFLLWVTL
jgi:hypothetical protein